MLEYSWTTSVPRPCLCLYPHPPAQVRVMADTLQGVVRAAVGLTRGRCQRSNPDYNGKPNAAVAREEIHRFWEEGFRVPAISEMTGYSITMVRAAVASFKMVDLRPAVEGLLEQGLTVTEAAKEAGVSRYYAALVSKSWRAANR